MPQMDTNINFRMALKDKIAIEHAARLQGLKPNTYARKRLMEAAERDLADINQLNNVILNNDEWDNFIKILDAPVKINPKLKKAVKNYKKVFG